MPCPRIFPSPWTTAPATTSRGCASPRFRSPRRPDARSTSPPSSTQDTDYQREAVERLHLPFELLSDEHFELVAALRLPTFELAGLRFVKRITLIVRDGVIEKVFYPVFPPDGNAEVVAGWLGENP